MEAELTNLAYIVKILDSIGKEVTLKVLARQAFLRCFIPPGAGISRELQDERITNQTNRHVYQPSITHPKL